MKVLMIASLAVLLSFFAGCAQKVPINDFETKRDPCGDSSCSLCCLQRVLHSKTSVILNPTAYIDGTTARFDPLNVFSFGSNFI